MQHSKPGHVQRRVERKYGKPVRELILEARAAGETAKSFYTRLGISNRTLVNWSQAEGLGPWPQPPHRMERVLEYQRRRATRTPVRGEWLSFREIVDRYGPSTGVTRNVVAKRYRNGARGEELIAPYRPREPRRVKHRGEWLTLTELARLHQVSPATVQARWERGDRRVRDLVRAPDRAEARVYRCGLSEQEWRAVVLPYAAARGLVAAARKFSLPEGAIRAALAGDWARLA